MDFEEEGSSSKPEKTFEAYKGNGVNISDKILSNYGKFDIADPTSDP